MTFFHPSKAWRAVAALLIVSVACTTGPSGEPDAAEPVTGVAPRAHFTPQPVPQVTRPAPGPLASGCRLSLDLLERIRRGYFPGRSPDITIVPRPPNFFGGFIGQSHNGPWDYLQEVPLVFYGPGFVRSLGSIAVRHEATLADIAPTFADLLGVKPPPGEGRALRRILVPKNDRPGRPRLLIALAWDGGGTNVLETWPHATPNLKRMMRMGTSIEGATAGSSPSITPSIHATIGTGTFPERHGITGIPMRVHGEMTSAWAGWDPAELTVPTLADTYDKTTHNAAKVGLVAFKGWHLGMIGHGAEIPGGDHDVAVIVGENERLRTNPEAFSLPPYLANTPGLRAAIHRTDLEDGKADEAWMGHDLTDVKLRRDSPAWSIHQTDLIERLLKRDRFGQDAIPDLFFTNYKQPDEVGHRWNMLYPEMKPTLQAVDAMLGRLKRFLDATVGHNRWVMAITADHGQGPLPEAAGAWPISINELRADIGSRFDKPVDQLLMQTNSAGFWVDPRFDQATTVNDIATFLINYRLEDNAGSDRQLTPQYADRRQEPIIEAAFPTNKIDRILECARRRSAGDG